MIDIIGNIKIDENNPQRVKQLIACIRSYAFMADQSSFVLFLEDASGDFRLRIADEIQKCGFCFWDVFNGDNTAKQYGKAYIPLIEHASRFKKNDFVLNFMEDHFCMLDNPQLLMHLLGFMKQYKADVCKASFHHVEQNSIGGIKPISDIPGLGIAFENDQANHTAYCSHYADRYYIGVNFLTTREFALKFWNRQLGPRPHPYEIGNYDPSWQHRCAIPHFEFLTAIEDGHGESGSNLLQRPDAKKFLDIYNGI